MGAFLFHDKLNDIKKTSPGLLAKTWADIQP